MMLQKKKKKGLTKLVLVSVLRVFVWGMVMCRLYVDRWFSIKATVVDVERKTK